MISYIKAISIAYPNVHCSAIGDGSDYDLIVWESGDTLPSKADLDTFIAQYTDIAIPDHYTFDAVRNRYLSPILRDVTFSSQAVGAKNYYLSLFGQMSSNIHGYIVAEKSAILSSDCRIADSVSSDVTFELYADNVLTHSVTIPAGQKIIAEKTLNIDIAADSILSCKVVGAKIDYPLCRFMLAGA